MFQEVRHVWAMRKWLYFCPTITRLSGSAYDLPGTGNLARVVVAMLYWIWCDLMPPEPPTWGPFYIEPDTSTPNAS